MEVKVFKRDGSQAGAVNLDASVFDVTPNDHAIWLDVRSIQANARQGTHKAKERGEVRGGGAKPWRQKGTGRARAGTSRSPLWVGGGTVFGPRPHTYSVGVNRKTKQVARRSALTYKAKDDAIRVVEDFSLEVPKTREIADMLSALSLAGRKVLFLTTGYDDVVYRAGRNLPTLTIKDAQSVSTLDVLGAHIILMQRGALDVISQVLGGTTVSSDEADVVEEVAE